MYDTVNFIIYKDDYPNTDFLDTFPKYLDKIEVKGEGNTGPFVNGMLGTYSVIINRYRMKLHQSSLARYINNNNQDGMSLQLTRKALEMISEQLHINMDKAKVTRIDVGRNIITKYSPETYLPFLGELQGFKRLEAGDGLYYKNTQKELVLYNKIKEQKHKRLDIQTIFKDKNLFRYELRIKNHLERQLNYPRITGDLLYNEEFYINVAKLWRDHYLKITKLSNPTNVIYPTTSTRELMSNIASIKIRDIGDEALIRMVALWSEQGLLSKKQASDHRKAIRESVKKDMKFSGNEFIEELDKKIMQSVRYFI